MGSGNKRVFWTIASIIGLVVILYGVDRFKGYWEGPSIVITSPPNGATVSNSLISIEGQAEQIAFITLNDRQIFVDENGHIFEELLLYPGLNIISLKANDRFGRKVEERLELVYSQN